MGNTVSTIEAKKRLEERRIRYRRSYYAFLPPILCTKINRTEFKEEFKYVVQSYIGQKRIQNCQILIYVPKLPHIIKYINTKRFAPIEFLYLTQAFFGYCAIDRTGTLTGDLDVKILDPVPKFDPSFNKDLAQICRLRAKQIMDVAVNRGCKIYILWSGGIDSTAVMVAFLETQSIELLKEKVIVLYTQASISEYPKFFRTHSKLLNFQLWSGYFDNLLGSNNMPPLIDCYRSHTFAKIGGRDLLVTGEHGDQLFGSDKMKLAFHRRYIGFQKNVLYGNLDAPWQDVIPEMLEQSKGVPKGVGLDWAHWIFPQVAKAPIPILTAFDFLWWMNFSLKWQNVTMRILMKCSLNQSQLSDMYNRMYHFYRTEDFQQWSYHNHKHKLPDRKKWSTYKQPLKDYIFNYTKDKSYHKNKEKKISLKLKYQKDNRSGPNVAITASFEQIGWGRNSISIDLMKKKYGSNAPLSNLLVPNQTRIPILKKEDIPDWAISIQDSLAQKRFPTSPGTSSQATVRSSESSEPQSPYYASDSGTQQSYYASDVATTTYFGDFWSTCAQYPGGVFSSYNDGAYE